MMAIHICETYKCISILIVLLIILIIVRMYLIKKANKRDLEIGVCSTIGNEEIQENHLGVAYAPHGVLGILADGLGKNQSGKISSIVAVETIKKLFLKEGSKEKIKYFFKKSFNTANREILKRIDNDNGGTSVISTIVVEDLLHYALVGDTMLAVFRDKELIRISDGHTLDVLAQKEFYKGKLLKEQAINALHNKKLLYYLGQEPLNNIEIFEKPIKLNKGDIVTLMSRGIYDVLAWTTLENIIGSNQRVEEKAKEIIRQINLNKRTNKNNGSIILMKYVGN